MTEAWHIAVFYLGHLTEKLLACGDRNAYNISYPGPILTHSVHFILAQNGMEDGGTNKPMAWR